MEWLAQTEVRAFLIGAVLLLTGAAILLVVAFPRKKEPQPEPRTWTVPQVVFHDTPPPANYHRGGQVHAWYVEPPDAVTEVLDLAEAQTAVLEKFLGDQEEPDTEPDPLDDTVELPVIDDDTPPLYFTIRHREPPPLHLESFTTGWTTEQVQRAIASGRPE